MVLALVSTKHLDLEFGLLKSPRKLLRLNTSSMAVGLSSGFALKVAVFRASLALRGEMIGDDAL